MRHGVLEESGGGVPSDPSSRLLLLGRRSLVTGALAVLLPAAGAVVFLVMALLVPSWMLHNTAAEILSLSCSYALLSPLPLAFASLACFALLAHEARGPHVGKEARGKAFRSARIGAASAVFGAAAFVTVAAAFPVM